MPPEAALLGKEYPRSDAVSMAGERFVVMPPKVKPEWPVNHLSVSAGDFGILQSQYKEFILAHQDDPNRTNLHLAVVKMVSGQSKDKEDLVFGDEISFDWPIGFPFRANTDWSPTDTTSGQFNLERGIEGTIVATQTHTEGSKQFLWYKIVPHKTTINADGTINSTPVIPIAKQGWVPSPYVHIGPRPVGATNLEIDFPYEADPWTRIDVIRSDGVKHAILERSPRRVRQDGNSFTVFELKNDAVVADRITMSVPSKGRLNLDQDVEVLTTVGIRPDGKPHEKSWYVLNDSCSDK